MLTVRIAELNIELDNRHGYVEELCRDYRVPAADAAFRVSVGGTEVGAYLAAAGRAMTAPEAEAHLLYRRICEKLPAYDALLLHAAVVEMDGRGYAFCAPRGMGKTTHTTLWQNHFSGRAAVINGDKPIVRLAPDGRLWAYGTPWCGKEGKNENRRVPLSALCFLKQAPRNSMTPTATADTVTHLLASTVLPPEPALQDRMAALVGIITRQTPAYTLACRPDAAAAELAYELLSQI